MSLKKTFIFIFIFLSFSLQAEENKIQFHLNKLENNISSLNYIFDNKLSNPVFKSKKESLEKLQRAKSHLLLGNEEAAILEVTKNLKNIDPNDVKEKVFAYKILFESYRIGEKYKEATQVCLNMLLEGDKAKNLWTEKWKNLCSYAFYQSSKTDKSENAKKNLHVWDLSGVISNPTKYNLLSHIFISLAYRNTDKNKNSAVSYLKSAILKSDTNNLYLGKAYLTLSLLNYESGKKESSFSQIQDLVLSKEIKNNDTPYFEVDSSTQLLAKLTFARMHAALGNLAASETWYSDISNVQKDKAQLQLSSDFHFEYAHILYKEKKYKESEIELKKFLQNETFSSLFVSHFHTKFSRIILANILNKSLEKKEEGQSELKNLIQTSNVDLNYINQNKKLVENNSQSIHEQVIPLAALAADYGIESPESIFFIKKYLEIEYLNQKVFKNKVKLLNSINSIDDTDSGVYEVLILNCINKINENFQEIKKSIRELDEASKEYFYTKSPQFSILYSHRLELLRRLQSMDDSISIYKDKFMVQSLYKKNILNEVKLAYKNLNQSRAFMSSAYVLNKKGMNSQAEINFQTMDNKIVQVLFDYRKFLLKTEIFPTQFYSFNQKFGIYSDSLLKIVAVDKKLRSSELNQDTEVIHRLDKNWEKLIELNKKNNLLLQVCIDKINRDRNKIFKSFSLIEDKITAQEKSLQMIQSDVFKQVQVYYPTLLEQTKKKIEEFKNHVEIAMAQAHKNEYENDKAILKTELEIKENRKKWVESLDKTLNMDLFR